MDLTTISNPVYLARRIAKSCPGRVLVARTSKSGVYSGIYILDEKGIWRGAADHFHRLVVDVIERDEISQNDKAQPKIAQAMKSGFISDVKKAMTILGEADGVTVARSREMNADTRYLGVANGVLDIESKTLITDPKEASKCLVTRQAPTPYEPDAYSGEGKALVDSLFSHLDPEVSLYYEIALAVGLHGAASKMLHASVGQTDSGKSGIVAIMNSTYGDEYVSSVDDDLLRKSERNARSLEAKRGIVGGIRWAVMDELSMESGRFSKQVVKRITGEGGEVEYTDLFSSAETGPVTASIHIFCNKEDVPRVGMTDTAVFGRFRFIEFSPLPEDRIVPLFNRVETKREDFRKAMLCRQVALASEHVRAGEIPQSSKVFALAVKNQELGEFGSFCLQHIEQDPDGILWTKDFYEAWAGVNGIEPDHKGNYPDKVVGVPRQHMCRHIADCLDGFPRTGVVDREGERVGTMVKGFRFVKSGNASRQPSLMPVNLKPSPAVEKEVDAPKSTTEPVAGPDIPIQSRETWEASCFSRERCVTCGKNARVNFYKQCYDCAPPEAKRDGGNEIGI